MFVVLLVAAAQYSPWLVAAKVLGSWWTVVAKSAVLKIIRCNCPIKLQLNQYHRFLPVFQLCYKTTETITPIINERCLVFGRFRVRIQRPTILTGVFHGFPRFLQTHRIELRIKATTMCFPIHYSPNFLPFGAINRATDGNINYTNK